MHVTFLGTGSGAPSTRRNVSGIALGFDQKSKWWLFDCGEGTQHQILRSALKISQLEKIFITHLHGDHLYGLIGLLASRSLRNDHATPVELYGPPGVDRYLKAVMDVSPVHLHYPLQVKIIQEGIIYEDEECTVICRKVQHRIPAYAYAVREKEKPGTFLVERAKSAGIPPGPLYAALKRGEQITLPDGRVVSGADYVGPPQPGRTVVFSGDTEPCEAVAELAEGADLLIHEATYAFPDKELAVRSGHSTAREAAQMAKRAGVKALVLTHFSPRYENEDGELTMEDLLKEAQEVFPDTTLAADFASFTVRRERKTAGEER
ncbi:ribonuclease Z [Brevibacillus ruminantium]|uniref:Ribonuclease Z n=1 Tax=Brevibacillus ruminantium TaxID=2950604 RepID=A0ABY4WNW1_9BACL|nr:ribonuclease Z [Brevibacillus ruminantium]USG68446.1 ribonuclease Z [Brevibacillus ruminantium]